MNSMDGFPPNPHPTVGAQHAVPALDNAEECGTLSAKDLRKSAQWIRVALQGDSRHGASAMSSDARVTLEIISRQLDTCASAVDMWAAPEPASDFERSVRRVVTEIQQMLVAKNQAYGNSALDPLRVFSTADPAEQIRVRIDDKLSRLSRGHAAGEDVIRDLLGYLILLLIAQEHK